jgi:hypothetical protein
VLIAVQEAQDQTSGKGSSMDALGFSSVGAGLTTDPSLYVLPAVEAASRNHHNAGWNAQQQFELNEALRAADDEKARSPLQGVIDFSLDLSEPGDDTPMTDARANNADEDATVLDNPSSLDEQEENRLVQTPDAPTANAVVSRADITVQLQRLSRHHSTMAQAGALALLGKVRP